MSKIFKTSYRVYYEDTDAEQIMYHGNFINFCERARTDLLREIGLPVGQIKKELGVGFVVRHIAADYVGMVRLDDLLEAQTSVKTMKNSSFVMHQELICQNKVVFMMDVTIVCIDAQGKPTRAPQELRDRFQDYLIEESK